MAKARRTPRKAASPRGKATKSRAAAPSSMARWIGLGLAALGGIIAYDHRDLLPAQLLNDASRQVATLAAPLSRLKPETGSAGTDRTTPTASIPKPATRPMAQAGAGVQAAAAHGAFTLAPRPLPNVPPGPRPPLPVGAGPTMPSAQTASTGPLAPPVAAPKATAATMTPVLTPQAAQAAAMPKSFYFCGIRTDNCVISGDTFVYRGAKIHLADIAAPNAAAPKCEEERKRGFFAKERLMALLNAGPIDIGGASSGPIVTRDGRSIGQQLVAEGFARPASVKASWCGGA
ncbi:hypothetical protein [Xaviernesmea oryzae]|nr:hypothetical protein [Xaviernesmea oryzae]SEK65497.1 Endonuclease YncB, thermonuclease family [Xaviernesmea oryzae]